MSDQNSLFTNQNSGATTPNNEPAPNGGANVTSDPLNTMLANIKNERGEQKYKTVEDALKALQHAQEYIPSLKNTSQELEQKLNDALAKAAKVEQLEAAVLELTQSVSRQATPANTGFDEGKIAELVNQSLTKAQQEALALQNTKKVVTVLQSTFGEKAEEVFYARAAEVGMSRVDINSLAQRNPDAVLKLIGIGSSPATTPTTPAGVNTAGFTKNPDSLITSNKKSVMVGATTQEVMSEREASKKMVDELHSQGLSVNSLTDPKVYFKHFGK